MHLYPNNNFWYVKGTQFRSPLHQHKKRLFKSWNNTSLSFKNNWVWENFREDYITPALFAGFTGTILIVCSQTLNFEMFFFHYLMDIFHWMLVQWTSKLCPFHISKLFLGYKYTLKVPRNPNACWLPLIRSDVYTTYRLTLGYKCVSYILSYFFNNFFLMCYAPPPKKPSKLRFLRWHHLSIISQLAYLEQRLWYVSSHQLTTCSQ